MQGSSPPAMRWRKVLAMTILLLLCRLAAAAPYLKAEDIQRVAIELSVTRKFIFARADRPWAVVHLDAAIFAAADAGQVPANLYLVAGQPALDDALVMVLPKPPGSQEHRKSLNGKGFIGGAVSAQGSWSSHLLPADVLRLVPLSHRRFVWWDQGAKRMNLAHSPLSVATSTTDFFPTPGPGESFSLRAQSARGHSSLMIGLTAEGLLILMLKGVRDAIDPVDLDTAASGDHYVVSEHVYLAIGHALREHGDLGERAAAAMSSLFITSPSPAASTSGEDDRTGAPSADVSRVDAEFLRTFYHESRRFLIPAPWERVKLATMSPQQRFEHALWMAADLYAYVLAEPAFEPSIKSALPFPSTPTQAHTPLALHHILTHLPPPL